MRHKVKYNRCVQGLAFILAVALLLPASTKFAHLFSHHNHEICSVTDTTKTHFHNLDYDCEFYIFNVSASDHYILDHRETKLQSVSSVYNDFYKKAVYQQLHTSSYQRGPPQLA